MDRENVNVNPGEETADSDQAGAGNRRFARGRALGENLWNAVLGTAVSVRHRARRRYHRLARKGARYQRLRAHYKAVNQPQARPEPAPRISAVERLHTIEHNLEHHLDRGRDNTLHWIGVPSRKDFEALEQKVETLSAALEELRGATPEQKTAPGRRKASA